MFDLKKLLFKSSAPAHLPDDVRAALEIWRAMPAPDLGDIHFHVRYVVVDIASTGFDPETDQLLSISATALHQGSILPEDAFHLDLTASGEDSAVDRKLAAFLQFAAKAPLVTFHVSHVGGFLRKIFGERLGVDFQPQWVDLAWLLPTLFEEKAHQLQPLDQWVGAFGLPAGNGRRDAMENTLLLARILQMLIVRAVGKQVDTAERLIEESRASSFLRRTH